MDKKRLFHTALARGAGVFAGLLAAFPLAVHPPSGQAGPKRVGGGPAFKEELRLPLPGAALETTIISGGAVYAVTGAAELVRVDLASGRTTWRAGLDGAVSGLVATSTGEVVVLDPAGVVSLVSASDGSVISRFAAGTAPVGVEELKGFIFIRSSEGRAFKFDRKNGHPSIELESGLSSKFTAGPVIAGGLAIFGDSGGRLTAFQPDGAKLWTYAASGPILDNMAAVDGRLYFGTGDRWFHSLSVAGGKLKWKTRLTGCAAWPVSVSGRKLVLATTASVVYCLKKRTGVTNWWRAVGSRVFDRPIASESLVFISGDIPGIDVLDLISGEKRDRAGTPDYSPGRCRLSALWYTSGRLAALGFGDCAAGAELVFFAGPGRK